MREVLSVCLFAGGLFLLASICSYIAAPSPEINVMGPFGARIAEWLVSLLGWCALVTVLWSLLLARTVWEGNSPSQTGSLFALVSSISGSLVMAASAAVIATVLVGQDGGGRIGSILAYKFIRHVNEAGTLLISVSVFLLSLSISTGVGTKSVLIFGASLLKILRTVARDSWYVLLRIMALFGRVGGEDRGVFELCGAFIMAVVKSLWLLIRLPYVVVRSFCRAIAQVATGRRKSDLAELPEPDDEYTLGIEDGEVIERRANKRLRISHQAREGASPAMKAQRRRKKLRRKAARETEEREEESRPSEGIDHGDYKLPSAELLISGSNDPSIRPDDHTLQINAQCVEQALQNFRIGGRVVEVQPGPVITLYQFEPAAGVKVQRIVSLADDLALALKVASVRVYAPVPGKGTIGIEVPNVDREIVRLRDLIENERYTKLKAPLPIALGKDTFGEVYVTDLTRMPHLLIAGATGSGKSVCINSVLLSFLYRHTPAEMRLILIDPKMLELSVYEGIPHLKAPVVTNPKRAKGVLWWAVEEMERRYQLMKDMGARNLANYNQTVLERQRKALEAASVESDAAGLHHVANATAETAQFDALRKNQEKQGEHLPRIVIVVDELADLMLTVGREIEELLTRLAQKARAAGIHLIVATQRPSVNVITGLIKANFPARVSFKVASRIDARTVMDSSGAEKLLGDGDMLFLNPGSGRIKRLHAPLVTDQEVYAVGEALRAQGAPDYDAEIESMVEKIERAESSGIGMEEGNEFDPLYDQAVTLVLDKGQASTSMVQRVFRIGYNRAARILETMEREGVVGPADGAKPRTILAGSHHR